MEAYILLLFSLCVTCRLVSSLPEQSRLFDNLFQIYDRRSRPIHKLDEPTNVTISLQLKYIHGYDPEKRILSIYGWLNTQWTDYRLRWEPFDYGGVTHFQVPHSLIWKPDVMMVNSIDPEVPALPSSSIYARVESNGAITLFIPSMFRSPCVLSGKSISCAFKFISWMHNGYEINLLKTEYNGVDLTGLLSENPGVKILSTNATRTVEYYACCVEPYPIIEFSLNIDPKSSKTYSSGSYQPYMSQMFLLSCLVHVTIQRFL